MSNISSTSIKKLGNSRRKGFALPGDFYNDGAIFEADVKQIISRQWILVGHDSEIPNVGDYFLYTIAGESIIVVRSPGGVVRAFFNVCRHRGSRICSEPTGHRKTFVCPYHAWTYRLDGTLAAAPGFGSTIDLKDYPLASCRLESFEGLLFINLSASNDTPSFQSIVGDLNPVLRPHGIARAKVACKKIFMYEANWKLAVENFLECYHCQPAHPQFSDVNEYVKRENQEPGYTTKITLAWNDEAKKLGHFTGHVISGSECAEQPYGAGRMPIRKGFLTHTKDGTPAAPLMGDFKHYDGGQTEMYIGFLSWIYALNDHAVLFRMTPVSHRQTEVQIEWLVDSQAKEGKDYDVDKLSWLWTVTTEQDVRIVNMNQEGVLSRSYDPGPYARRENFTDWFVRWYLWRMGGEPVPFDEINIFT